MFAQFSAHFEAHLKSHASSTLIQLATTFSLNDSHFCYSYCMYRYISSSYSHRRIWRGQGGICPQNFFCPMMAIAIKYTTIKQLSVTETFIVLQLQLHCNTNQLQLCLYRSPLSKSQNRPCMHAYIYVYIIIASYILKQIKNCMKCPTRENSLENQQLASSATQHGFYVTTQLVCEVTI